MVKFCGVPLHVVPEMYRGVTVIVATTGLAVGFVALNEAMLPAPLAASPIDVSLLTQSNCVAVPLKLMAVVLVLSHTAWLAGITTDGVGFTVIVNT